MPRRLSKATNGRPPLVIADFCSFCGGSAGSPQGEVPGEALTASSSLSSARTACTLKGGYLSITTQGSYWPSSPHPLALSTASRPGKPATAETRSRAGTRGRRASASNQICRNTSQVKAQCQAQPALRLGPVSPALAHGCPDTPPHALPCRPRVRAGLYTPRGLLPEGSLSWF